MRFLLFLVVAALALAQSARKPAAKPRAAPTRWGQITGTLSNQQDLQGALDAKQDKGSTAQPSWGGIGGDIKTQSDLQIELNGRMPVHTKIVSQSGTAYTVQQSDAGALLVLNNPGATTVTVGANLPTGFTCLVLQLGGEITFTGNGAALRHRQNFTKSAGPYAVVSILGFAANTYALSGDMR